MSVQVALDRLKRPLRSLRISVTDRCNLRCGYCMPEPDYTWLPRAELLDFDEIATVVRAFCDAGVTRVRITGGEPLLRRDLHRLVAMLRREPRIEDLALTTNGLLLRDQATLLAEAGLHRITVSLDTLRADRFEKLTRRRGLAEVLDGIEAARATRLQQGLKIDTVALRGHNDDELLDLVRFGARCGAEVRFIEYMDVGGATNWRLEDVLTADDILHRVGPATALPGRGSAPAQRYALEDGTTFGIIASVTAPFCRDCDRSRVTADGMWLHCLYATSGVDLKTPLRRGLELSELIHDAWTRRDERGAELRAELPHRGALVPVDALRRNPHLEMHKRGG